MSQMTSRQARGGVDPVLTAVARGYNHMFAPVARRLFALVSVAQRGGTVIEFSQDDFRLVDSNRSPGQNTKRVQFGHAGAPYSLRNHSLEAIVPVEIEEEAASVGIDQQERSIRGVQRLIDIETENEAAAIARNAASYAASNKLVISSATDRWSDPTSDIIGQIMTAREAIRQKIGQYPNFMEVPAGAVDSLTRHPDIVGSLSDGDMKIATMQQVQQILKIPEIVVGEGSYWDGSKFVDIWGQDVVLAFTQTGTIQDGGQPSYGYTYQLEGYPLVEESYWDRNAKSLVSPITDVRRPVLAGALAGYLISGVVAAPA